MFQGFVNYATGFPFNECGVLLKLLNLTQTLVKPRLGIRSKGT